MTFYNIYILNTYKTTTIGDTGSAYLLPANKHDDLKLALKHLSSYDQ